MKQTKLEKDLIFYSPGEKGAGFTLKNGNFDNQLVDQTVNYRQHETENPVICTEDRRLPSGPSKVRCS